MPDKLRRFTKQGEKPMLIGKLPVWMGVLIFLAVPRGYSAELSLSDCLRMAREKSPQVIEALLNESRAQSARDELKRQNLPALSSLGTYSKSDDPSTQLHDANKAALRVEQSAYPFNSTWVRAQQKESEYAGAKLSHIETVQDVNLLVKQLYFSILKDQDAIKSLNQVEDQLKRLLETVLPKYTVGRAPPFDLVKIKLAISDLTRTRELTEAQLVGEKSRLAVTLGAESSADIQLKPISQITGIPERTESERNLRSNPTLRVLSQQIKSSEHSLRAVQYSRIPALIAAGEYGYAGQTADELSLGWDVSVGFKLPLFDWGTISSQVSQEKSSIRISKNKAQTEKQRSSSILMETLATAQAHLSDQKRLKDLLPETRQAALTTIIYYRRGANSILEVSDAINLWLQTLINERSAYYAYFSDLAQIERLTGEQVQYIVVAQ